MSRFGPVCRCRVDMMSGYSISWCRGQMRPDCVDRAIRNVGTELLDSFSLQRKVEAARFSEMLVRTSDTHTGVQPGGPQSEHTLPLEDL